MPVNRERKMIRAVDMIEEPLQKYTERLKSSQ